MRCTYHFLGHLHITSYLRAPPFVFLFAMPAPATHSLDSTTQPSHGYPVDESTAITKAEAKDSTASHPPTSKPDPTTSSAPAPKFNPSSNSSGQDAAEGGVATAASTGSSELAGKSLIYPDLSRRPYRE